MNVTDLVEDIVSRVLTELNANTAQAEFGQMSQGSGVFSCVNQAVAAATQAQRQLIEAGIPAREKIISILKQISSEHAHEWGKLELDETGVGRLDHKVTKLEILEQVPGAEFIRPTLHSGDEGVAFDEVAPWGVIGCVTPVTHSIPTITGNAISMIAAGNSMVINPHPSGAKCAAVAVETYNQAIYRETGIKNLIALIYPSTLESANKIFSHPDVSMLVIVGGAAVAKSALSQNKKAIVAGPGNPPVVVDETADLDLAAKSIIEGAAFDNNLLCIGEKEVFVVDRVFEKLSQAMASSLEQNAVQLTSGDVDRLTGAAFIQKGSRTLVKGDFIGQSCEKIAALAGIKLPGHEFIDLLFGETSESNPFVSKEQMMPFIPLVRVPDVNTAIEKAIEYEHHFRHTAIIHSQNMNTITRMGKLANTTVFVANGPSTAGLGLGGPGYPSFAIATPTGEGITNPLTFTRNRRMTINGSLRMI